MPQHPPELLLPVGDQTMLEAAVHNGADAVYIGVPGFNARGRTKDFSVDELRQMIEYAHLYGVKVNLAFNVLIFQEELTAAQELLSEILPLQPDAIIVQDLGLATLIRAMGPHQPIHASTQMTITNADAMELLSDLNINRFVLGREVSIPEMQKIKEQTQSELEVFVHGALCVSYSGQCFTSESLGGRSANRGQCAQSCRLPYDLIVDGKKMDMQGRQYVVSPKDLCGLDDIKTLKDIGIDSFKVVGRLKSPEYVASAAQSYRHAIDGAGASDLQHDRSTMGAIYSRGFFSGWLHGVDHQQLVDGHYSDHRGTFLGTITQHKQHDITLNTSTDPSLGDGILIVMNKQEIGGPIFGLKRQGQALTISMGKSLTMPASLLGASVYFNGPHKISQQLSQTWSDRQRQKKIPLVCHVRAQLGSPLEISFEARGQHVKWQSPEVLTSAHKNAATVEDVKLELSRLNQTPFLIAHWEMQFDDGLFIPNQWCKQARQALSAQLETTLKSLPINNTALSSAFANVQIPSASATTRPQSALPQLNILLRQKVQVDDLVKAIEHGELRAFRSLIGYIMLDFEFGRDYRPSLELLRSHGLSCALATNRILKPMEYHHLKGLLAMAPDALLVRNLGALHFITRHQADAGQKKLLLIGDFSLNVANALSADYLLRKGLDRITPSLDLNRWQLEKLLLQMDRRRIEMPIHHHLAEFHMEHCVFAAFLSKGSSFRDCGRPCESHKVELIDPYQQRHLLQADQECRNTMFRSAPQTAARMIEDWRPMGLSQFRLEFVDEASQTLINTIATYAKLLQGQQSADQLLRDLNLSEAFGVTEGQLSVADNYQNRKQKRYHLPES